MSKKDKHKNKIETEIKTDKASAEEKKENLLTPEAQEKINELKILSMSIEQEKEKTELYYNQIVALKAEFDNYRKRTNKELGNMIMIERKSVLSELLPVMDNVLRMKESIENKEPNIMEGMEIILREMEKVFTGFKIKKMECIGKEFSPEFHEAVLKQKTDSHKAGTVINVVNNGYYIGEEVLKPATVVIAEKPEKEENGKREE